MALLSKKQLPIVLLLWMSFLGCKQPKMSKEEKTTELSQVLINKAARNNSADSIIVELLKEFYTAHNEIMLSKLPDKTKTDSAVFDSLVIVYQKEEYRKTDSLNRIYCTERLRREAKEVLELGGYGHDILTGDRVGLFSNENLTVVKDSNSNYYVVQFLASDKNTWFTDNSSKKGELFHQKVILRVKIKEKKGEYKIDSIDAHESYWVK